VAPADGTLELALSSDEDLGVFVQLACNDEASELGCADANIGAGAVETLSVALFQGETAFVLVGGYTADDVGAYSLDSLFVADANGTCDAPFISTAPVTLDGNNADASDVTTNSCQLAGGRDDVHAITIPFTGTLSLTLNSSADLGVFVQTRCGDDTSELNCADSAFGGAAETLSELAFEGETLFVVVSGYDGTEASAYTLDVDMIPLEDGTCDAPIFTDVPGTIAGNTTGQADLGEGSCQTAGTGLGPDDVHVITAPETGILTLTLDSAEDLGIFVRTECGDAASEIGCRDSSFGGTTETLDVAVIAGETLYVVVGGYQAADVGAYTLDLSFVPLEDGTCDAPFFASVPSTQNDDNTTATDFFNPSCAGLGGRDVAYDVIAPADGTFTFTVSSADDMVIAAYLTCGRLDTQLDCNDAGDDGFPETIDVFAFEGEVISVVVTGFNGTENGPYTLDIDFAAN
jgi:hypothetical protein